MPTIIDVLAAFDKISDAGPSSAAYISALAAFGEVDVESLADIASLLTIAVVIIREGHSEVGANMVERASFALQNRLKKLHTPP